MTRPRKRNSATDIISKLFGEPVDNKAVQKLKDYVRHTNIFPEDFIQRDENTPHYQGAISFSEDAEPLIINIFLLDSLFKGKMKFVEKLINQHIDNKLLSTKLELTKKDLLSRFNAYLYWLDRFDRLKEIIEQDRDFKREQIHCMLDTSISSMKTEIPDFLCSSKALALHTVRLMEVIEEKASYIEGNHDDMAKKAEYYIRLGEPLLAHELLNEILEQDPIHSYTLYLKAILYLERSIQARQTAFQHEVMIDWQIGTALTGEERWREEMLGDSVGESIRNENLTFDMLLKAYEHWPFEVNKEEQINYVDSSRRNLVMKHIIHFAFKRSHPDLTSNALYINKAYRKSRKLTRDTKVMEKLFPQTEEETDYFGPEIDVLILNLLSEYDSTQVNWDSEESFLDNLKRLHIYSVVDQGHYLSHFPKWYEGFKSTPAEILKRHIASDGLTAQILFEHLGFHHKSDEIIDLYQNKQADLYQSNAYLFDKAKLSFLVYQSVQFYYQRKYEECERVIVAAIEILDRDQGIVYSQEKKSEQRRLLYTLIRVAFDKSEELYQNKDWNASSDALYAPFEKFPNIINGLKEGNYIDSEIDRELGYQYDVDIFNNEEDILEIDSNHMDERRETTFESHVNKLLAIESGLKKNWIQKLEALKKKLFN